MPVNVPPTLPIPKPPQQQGPNTAAILAFINQRNQQNRQSQLDELRMQQVQEKREAEASDFLARAIAANPEADTTKLMGLLPPALQTSLTPAKMAGIEELRKGALKKQKATKQKAANEGIPEQAKGLAAELQGPTPLKGVLSNFEGREQIAGGAGSPFAQDALAALSTAAGGQAAQTAGALTAEKKKEIRAEERVIAKEARALSKEKNPVSRLKKQEDLKGKLRTNVLAEEGIVEVAGGILVSLKGGGLTELNEKEIKDINKTVHQRFIAALPFASEKRIDSIEKELTRGLGRRPTSDEVANALVAHGFRP